MRVAHVVASAVFLSSICDSAIAQPQQGETVYALVANSVVSLRISDDGGNETGTATGFVIAPDIVLTNAHVANAGHVSVLAGPISVACETERIDIVNDLASCRMQAKANVPPLKFATTDPKPGSTIYVIGNPRGLDKTISQGLFTGYREIEGRNVIQMSAAISPGSSGGPIVNSSGEVVAVTVSSLTIGQNLNFGVPLGAVRDFLSGKAATNTQSFLGVLKATLISRDNETLSFDTNSAYQRLDRNFVETFTRALSSATELPAVQQLYDVVVVEPWHPELSLEAARKALSLSKRPDRQQYSNLAFALFRVNTDSNPTLPDAAKAATRAVELGLGKNAEDLLLLGDIEQARKDNQSAYANYRKAELLLKPGDLKAVNAYVDLFQASRDLGRPTEADQWFTKAKAESTITGYNWNEYAQFLTRQSRHRDSAIAYLEGYRLLPTAWAYVCYAGSNYWAADAYGDALATLRKCIEIGAPKPNSESEISGAHRLLAAILNDRGVYDEAASQAKEAIQINNSDAWSHYQLLRAFKGQRRFSEAINEGKTALRLSDGKFSAMHFELGSVYFELKQWPEAAQTYQKAAEMDPTDATSAYNVAVSLYNDKYYNQALTWYREVLKRDPNVSDRQDILRMIDTLSRR